MQDLNPYNAPGKVPSAQGDTNAFLADGERRILIAAIRASKERWVDMGLILPAILLLGIATYHYYRGYQHAMLAKTSIGEILLDDAGGFRDDSYDGDYVRAIDKLMTGTMVLFAAVGLLWFAFYARKRALVTARLYTLLCDHGLMSSVNELVEAKGQRDD